MAQVQIMAPRIALWSDSTYGALEDAKVLQLTRDLGLPLSNYCCSYGAGLVCKGDETGLRREAAEIVVIEMGYNDDGSICAEEAMKKMQKQAWFSTLSEARSVVKRVIFIQQPSYHQVAGSRKRRKKGMQWQHGAMVHGSKWNDVARKLLHEQLGVEVCVLDVRGEELYAGLTRDADGELWQDASTCRAYTSHGIEYSENGQPALWADAEHPSAAGAEAHVRRLVAALQEKFGLGTQSGTDDVVLDE
eukprot:gnl/TRDRNA2_/TRDRNA2_30107_c0_seq1.p1 gnl/TRDRNA2_/TRDRNA2_30107_c0~~gnl/TRDRNA2_/TRDRNA2_30107_c0_seq1.p1  ORF type:complete len:247 (-),score=37.04 gnl/TRDRNA2_/TRDRNA2_30107_c0_seq1:135-875(-)